MPRKSRKETKCAKCGKMGHYQTECNVASVDLVEEKETKPISKKKREAIAKEDKPERPDMGGYYSSLPSAEQRQKKISEAKQLSEDFNKKYSIGDSVSLVIDRRKKIVLRTISMERYGTAMVWIKGDPASIPINDLDW